MSDLYKKLYDYREKLRNRENRHTPTAVVADEPLKKLAALKPTTREDLLKISGIGNAFVNKYGDGFLNVILSESKPVKLTMMRKEVRDTLKNLQSRLTNVNRRNRMLYLPKPAPGRALDIGCVDGVVDALLRSRSITLCKGDSDDYAAFCRLMRAADSSARESGSNSLYAAYPFVLGSCGLTQDFNVAAPLVLFPVKLVNDNGKIVMSPDDSRDVTYNKALILCYNKFNNKGSSPLPPCALDYVRLDFEPAVLGFYKEQGINIAPSDSGGATKFFSYSEKTFPKFDVNGFKAVKAAALGLFPMYSGEIQKDFDDLIESGVMPATLTSLLEGADEVDDFYGDSVELVDGEAPIVGEASVDYINELNVSQEVAIERSRSERTLVMQGPPGTGKSQTITSMISDAVNKGQNVLVVSQKRAALSVIYSRLGKLSKYALFVDDSKDKPAFYGRLKRMFDEAERPAPFNSVAFDRAVHSVDNDIAELTGIADALKSSDYGAPMIRIYRENLDNMFKTAERELAKDRPAEPYKQNVSDSLLSCGYDEIKAARDYLDDEKLLETLDEYYSIGELYPWLIDMVKDMSPGKVAELISELDALLDVYAYDRFKFKYKRALKVFLRAHFERYDRAHYKAFKKDPVKLYNGVKAYGKFYDSKVTADSLDFCTRLYFGTLYNLKKETGEELIKLNAKLTEYCGYAFIDRFESENRDVISHINGFSTTVARICASIDKKVALTRDKTLNVLKSAFNANIAESKRHGEMLRAIDGKRRPEVGKFVEKFEFELFRGVRVFLMTPEAVSDILPLKNDLFDLLVFDEASQIYVERGIPAIARTKRLVVCGDHKQLRPSSLGDGRITVDEDEENEAVLEEESLLDMARFKFPEVMLSYHYRSRYEELIAFSDAAFYGGKLNISPNPVPPAESPIRVHKVNGLWEDRENKAEAAKVVELIAAHLFGVADTPQSQRDTLGVITFNAKQRDCILDMIDKKCDADPKFKALYLEEFTRSKDGEDLGLFVKNIENVQGDERDRIIFSFAYAYNAKGVMSRNFGWLNRPGGENRLNVAISRAKKRVDIVTSIVPTDLKVDDNISTGVKILRKYLDYAYCLSDGDIEGAKFILSGFSQPEVKTSDGEKQAELKEIIIDALEKRGITAEADVGMGNYKLDIALKNKKGEYVLGIEIDESALKTGLSTRERDVMRRKFLLSRGWNIYRVWSSDWYADPERVIKNIVAAAAA